jgi:DNA-binding CsgD family transcriptional regulator
MRGLFTLFHRPHSQTQGSLNYSSLGNLSPEFIEKYGLSSREAEVTAVLLKGNSNRAISTNLKIKVDTVKTHLKNIYRKTGTPGRYALMALVGLGNNK